MQEKSDGASAPDPLWKLCSSTLKTPDGRSWVDVVRFAYLGHYEGNGVFSFAVQGTSDTLWIDVRRMTHRLEDEPELKWTLDHKTGQVFDEENLPFHPDTAADYVRLYRYYWEAAVDSIIGV